MCGAFVDRWRLAWPIGLGLSVLCLSSTVRAQPTESASDAGTPTAAFPAQAPDAAPPLGEPPPRPESAEPPPPPPAPVETLPPASFAAPEPGDARYPEVPASPQPAASRWYGGQTLAVDGIAVGAITLDAAVLAREDVPAREAPRVGARPSFVVTRQHLGVGLAGGF